MIPRQDPTAPRRTFFLMPRKAPDTKSSGDPSTSSGNGEGPGIAPVAVDGDPAELDLLRTVFALVSDGILVLDTQAHVTYANPAAERALGFGIGSLLGKRVDELLSPRNGGQPTAAVIDLIQAAASGASLSNIEVSGIRADGTILKASLDLAPFPNQPSAFSLLIFRSVGDRQDIEKKLRESEGRFARFMENVPGLAWIKDAEGRYVFANDAAEEAFGVKRPRLYGLTDQEVFPPDIAASFVENDRKAADAGVVNTIETIKDETGNPRQSIVNKFRIPLDNGSYLVGGIAVDVTEQRQAVQHQDFLFAISEKIRVGRDASILLGEISELLGNYFGLHRCLFNEIDLENDVETVHRDFSRTGESVAGRHKISDYSPAASASMAAGQTIVNMDSSRDPRTADLFETVYGPAGEVAYVAVPMLREGRWAASLWCSDDKPRNWTPQEVALLENIAERTWAAVERLRTEEQLSLSAARAEVAQEAARSSLYEFDPATDSSFRNPAFEKVMGYAANDLPPTGAAWRELIHPHDAEAAWKAISEGLADGSGFSVEYRARHKEGHYVCLHDRARVIDDGIRKRVVGMILDITERKRTESGLRESEERLRIATDAARMFTWEIDHANGSIMWSRNAARLIGCAPDDLPSRRSEALFFVSADHRDRLYRELEAYTSAGRAEFSLEFPGTGPEDAIRHWHAQGRIFYDDAGNPIRTVGITQDVTDRKRAEEALLESQKFTQSILTAAPSLTYIYDIGQGRNIYMSDQVHAVLGYTPREIQDMGSEVLRTLIHPEDSGPVAERFARIMADTSGETLDLEYRMQHKSGSQVWLFDRARVFRRDKDGRPTQILGVATDVTERRLVEEQVRESERKYRTIFDSIDEGFVVVKMIRDDDGRAVDYRFIEANPAFTLQTGLPADALGRTAREILPDLEEFWFETYGRVASTGEPARFEHFSVPMERWFDVHASRVSGSEDRVAIVFNNITERKRIEEEIRRVSRVPIENPNPVMRISSDGELIFANPAAGPLIEHWKHQNGSELDPDFREILLTAYRSGKRKLTEIEFNERAFSLAVVPLPEAGYVNVYGADITERKKAELALRTSEERYRGIVNQALAGVAEIDLEGRFISVNDRYCQITARSREELMQLTVQDLTHPDDFVENRRKLDELLRDGKSFGVEKRYIRPDGSAVWVYNSVYPVRGADGEPRSIAAVVIDVTERRRAEQALRESEERFRNMADHAPVMIWVTEADGSCSYLSESWYEFTGRTPATGLGFGWLDAAHPDDREACEHEFTDANSTRRPFKIDYRLRGRDGEYRWVIDSAKPRFSDDGSFLGYIGSVFDITERRRAEVALRETEERFSKAFQASPLVLTISSLHDGRLLEVNETFVEVTGYSREEAIGKTTLELGLWESPPEREAEMDMIRNAGHLRNAEYVFRMRDGRRIVGLLSAERLEIGGEPCALTVIQDITERRESEERLRASEERLQLAQIAGNVGVWDWDIAADRTYWSETMWRFYGEEDRGANPDDAFWTEHLHELDRGRVKERLKECLASPDLRYRDEFRIRAGNGTERWIEAIANIVRDPGGKPVRMYGVNIDITERKLIEERVRNNERQLRLVTNSMPALIAYIDNSLRYRFVNERYSEWFGLPTGEIIGRKLREVLGDAAVASINPMLVRTLGGEPTSFQTEINYKRAGRKFVQVSYIPDVAEDGSVRGLYSLVSDLTEWKRSEERLVSSEQRVAMLMESVSDYAIFSTDNKGRIETWNVGAEKIFGYSADEAIGRSVGMLYTPEDAESGAFGSEKRTAQRSGKAADERWMARKDGSNFFASGVMMPLRVGRGIKGYVKIVSDLTEKKRRAENLQLAHDELEVRVEERTRDLARVNEALRLEMEERERSEAVKIGLLHRIVSAQETERQRIARDIHDQLGQRLTALRLKLAALRNSYVEGADVLPRVERLQEIARLLDSEVSFLASELRPNTLDDLGLEDALRAHAIDWSRHYEIQLDFHSNGLTGKRLGRDVEVQLYRIAQEALNNVAKHAKASRVNLLLEKAADSLVLIIEDDGVGFDPPRTPGKNLTRRLGLVGMHERATLIGASVEIESSRGEGTTIFVRLPVPAEVSE
jgi:PAS domain S-box-containing protein